SAMAGLALLNHQKSVFLTALASLSSAWLCLALRGRTEAFGALVNEKAKQHPGQTRAARRIRELLEAEGYAPKAGQDVQTNSEHTEEMIQDRYSLRCAPQILGPVLETLELVERWLEVEVNGVSDNPLIDEDGRLGMGGNFYGGYLSQGMDYLKISLAQIADLSDRQLTLLIDDKSNRGLPPNLANWPGLSQEERHLHHGLKGLHQAVNAITSEIMPKALANSIFSRSSESHNQDKVSLGMSAATQCHDMLEDLFHVQSMYLICLAQALDLRGIQLKGEMSNFVYKLVRSVVPYVTADRALDDSVDALSQELQDLSLHFERKFPSL
ncbi:MAG TPA: aromatic amino acid ammonia-lyase, partial [Bdellovibrionales bacterium]|nr:aromatic amino acid ammonia-lyase [Bdellovibrionales bacterium]